MTTQTTPTRLDLSDPATYADGPRTEYLSWLRDHDPVAWHPPTGRVAKGFWVCTKYHDIIAIERDVETFSSAPSALMDDVAGEDPGTSMMMLNQDPPHHTRLRNLVARGFTPKVMRSLEPHIRDAAVRIVDAAAAKGETDFVPDFAAELPLVVIAELMGIPYEDRHKVFDWSNRLVGNDDPEYGAGSDPLEAATELFAYAQRLADSRKERPMDDIVTQLVTAELDGEKLSDIEFNVFFLMLAVAGNETTRNLISGGMLTLFEHPDQKQRLVDDVEGLLPTAVDEMLRYVSPVMYFRRRTTRDTQIRGVPITAGDNVTMWYGAANRDPEVFPDPETFDVGRSPNDHIAFGGRGPHYCLGANLAKLEIRIMFEQILTRLPDITQAGPARHLQSNLINGIVHLPVRFTPRG